MRSRYHAEYPLAVKNPLNKEIIVGEVEFYLIQTTQITSGKQQNVSESINAEEIRLDQSSRHRSEIELTDVKEKRKLIDMHDASEFVESCREERKANAGSYTAYYYGSDFDFATKPDFQQKFKANALD